MGTYGKDRVSKAIFISSVPPFLLKTADNPEGVDGSIFDGIKKAIAVDRPAFLPRFLSDFYNVDVWAGNWSAIRLFSSTGTLQPAHRPRELWIAFRRG